MKHSVPLLQPDNILFASLKSSNSILMFGAGLYIQPAIHALSQHNRKPVCILDNASEKWGTAIYGVSVLGPKIASEKYPDSILIISAAPKYIYEIRAQMIGLGWGRVYDCATLLANFNYEQHTFPAGVSQLHFDLDKYFHQYFLINQPDKLVLRSLDVVVTERCSLKCRDCSNLMQYYVDPKDLEIGPLFDSLDQIMKAVDHVMELRVLGGETFMNKKVHQYVNRLREYPNYTRIVVYSNGTIIPQGENLKCLRYEDTYLRISDYGQLSKNVKKMTALFDEQNIIYNLDHVSAWQDCAEIKLRDRSKKDLELVYASCCANDTLTLLHGRLYICPYAANTANLCALPVFPKDALDLKNKTGLSQIREQLLFMLRKKKSFTVCQYCGGRPDDNTPLPPAVQVKTPRSFKKINTGRP